MKPSLRALGFVVLMAASGSAAATLLSFSTTLSGLNENPPNASPATGTALVTWDTLTNMMTVDVSFSGLLAPNTAAHIHCCTDPPNNVGVATPVPTFPGFPTGATSGAYLNTFDMLDAASYNPAFITNHGGTVAGAMADLLAGLQAGRAYLNIHSQMFGGGEIRGFLAQVPEPGTLLLLAVAGIALASARRRRPG